MIALWIAAALQSDWSELRLEREPSAEEVEKLRERLDAWGAARGDTFRGFGRLERLKWARVQPVLQVRATTLDERRELVVQRRPYEGEGKLVRTADVVDLHGPPLPPFEGFEGRQWRLPVEGSARTYPCPGCRADGRVTCARCQGRRTSTCDRCRKSGSADCPPCGGTSKLRCHHCFGWGNTGTGATRKSCFWCSGSGKLKCGACASGKVRCDPCRGKGEIDCGGCRGQGERTCDGCKGRATMVDTQEIVIWLRPSVREETASLLPGKWRSSGEAAWIAAEGEDVERRIGLIPDPAIADAARRTLEAARAGVAGRARGTQLRVRSVLGVRASLSWEALDVAGEVAWVGEELHFEESPSAAWAGREARRAEELYGTDRDEANRIAAAALRADPDCWRARRLVNAIESDEGEKRARLEHDRQVSSVKQLLQTGLFVLAGLIVVVMMLLKLYLRRRRTMLDPRGPQAL